jgi:hypothetical protein
MLYYFQDRLLRPKGFRANHIKTLALCVVLAKLPVPVDGLIGPPHRPANHQGSDRYALASLQVVRYRSVVFVGSDVVPFSIGSCSTLIFLPAKRNIILRERTKEPACFRRASVDGWDGTPLIPNTFLEPVGGFYLKMVCLSEDYATGEGHQRPSL